MPRVIPHEAMQFLRGALGDDGAIGIAVEGVDQTPAGPRVRFVVPRLRRARVDPQRVPDRDSISELVSRMVAMRWRYGAAPRPVPVESGLVLMETHPEIYSGPTETGDGWHWLLATVAEWIKEGGVPAEWQDEQVKEKYGTLRFYASGVDGRTARILAGAEWVSGAVCETCGAPGRTQASGWVRTACDAHAETHRG
ncbi:hypothetical protein MKK69_09190 [Methylobacterium sp. J-026]|jgi:hypothetical protein|uniref:hypothetical protein n=1 Tax=unclassified Methylobacterium TaxID=2615210 RepID=UPI001FBA0B67|nr:MULTISPECIES: hypothetical protein [unclassified Methylobacterium]MCJ2134226.1 hypothetical protein [Methylobacterium sp. J-026]